MTLLWLVLGLLASRRLVKNGREVATEGWKQSLSLAKAQLGIQHHVRLLESSEVSAPALAGLLRSAILLPVGSARWPAKRQETVLLHELAHASRRDNLTQLMASLARCLHWFNPLAWYATSQMQLLREHAADDAVLNAGIKASEYGDVLVQMARSMSRPKGAKPLAVSMARPSSLRSRIRHLLDSRPSRKRLGSRVAVLAGLAALSYALTVGAVGVDPRIAMAVERERAAVYPRPPLFAPGEAGRASDLYSIAEPLADSYSFYDEEAGDLRAYLTPETWSDAPAVLRELAESQEAHRIVDLIVAGASRSDGKSSYQQLDWRPVYLGDRMTPAIKMLDVVDAVALRAAELGDVPTACRYWLAAARYGQDIARGSALIGLMLGGSLELQAASQIRRMVSLHPLPLEELETISEALRTLVDSRPALGDTLWVEALWRAQHFPALADLDKTRALIKELERSSNSPSQHRSKLVIDAYSHWHEQSAWGINVGRADYIEASMRATYLYVALHVDRRTRGQWATSLDQLVPATIAEVPLDPISGSAFSYTADTATATLTSAEASPEKKGDDRWQVLYELGESQ